MISALLLAAALALPPGHPQTSATDAPKPIVAEGPRAPTPETSKNQAAETPKQEGILSMIPGAVTTRHRVVVGGRSIPYEATAGALPLKNDRGETDAMVFFVAYTAERAAGEPPRPLLFAFNGGPGSSAVWLHLGGVGPQRVRMLPDGSMPPPPFLIEENPETWLDHADLVFVDPVGTGYSRAANPELTKKYATVKGDIDSTGEFIRLYLSRYDRWGSPLFLAGESYGTFRAAGLSDYLLDHGIALNGVILISSIMNMQTIKFDQGNDLPYLLFLRSYAATAWYHGKLGPDLRGDLEKTLAEAEKWGETAYAPALRKGDRLSIEERKELSAGLARLTGLDAAFVENRNLRVDNISFAKELLRDRKLFTGFLDSRFTSPNLDPGAPWPGFDPTIAAIRPPFTAMFNDYIRSRLGYRCDLEYHILGGGIGHWDWEAKNGYADTSENLRNALAKNPYLRLFVGAGLFDLSTPDAAAEYTLSHMGLVPPLLERVTLRRYRTGHMMYLDEKALLLLKNDVGAFIDEALARRGDGAPKKDQ
jgi:carboxypeptidase C (cathepsin A)